MKGVILENDEICKMFVIDILISEGLAKSRAEAKRLISQGCIYINGEKINDMLGWIYEDDYFNNNPAIERR